MKIGEEKKVYMYQSDGQYIIEFSNLRESCLFLLKNNHVDSDKTPTKIKSNISKSIKNGWCAYGFKWSYIKEDK
jgi:hypothetical protein